MERMNIDQISHSLALCGMSAYRQTLLDLVRKNNEIQEQVEELQNQLSSEIMARTLPQREVVEELGNGWRIERQPNDSQDVTVTTTAEDEEGWPGAEPSEVFLWVLMLHWRSPSVLTTPST